ncbi:protein FMC1 homolog isoform X2 [Pollicipes pollicipes]|uniref:protein FMC1 homolog isoform X2 n=1 Tax=Pollicipes pollicipes TaxID=41117 RepID=UPI0018852941|nr:protein FMC1 homolog isoform X2 [Pollicipes pollicipes]XP_037078300.1 protein FMC1 homolog isoform X2 [Pollicipes pollicipes]
MTAAKWLVRGLLRELRASTTRPEASNMYRDYVLDTARRFQVTGEQHCRARDELTYLADTYRSYLRSRRRHAELLQAFRGRGERSVRDTAALVGFKLPHDPR